MGNNNNGMSVTAVSMPGHIGHNIRHNAWGAPEPVIVITTISLLVTVFAGLFQKRRQITCNAGNATVEIRTATEREGLMDVAPDPPIQETAAPESSDSALAVCTVSARSLNAPENTVTARPIAAPTMGSNSGTAANVMPARAALTPAPVARLPKVKKALSKTDGRMTRERRY
ncbi:hypothetical protein [uncultured Sphingomonas sp.]|uniref:hypothetical protein n=1 Tax=uncultured Sphingomonas sp. TaxID=158754 RepID=UPI0035CC66BC